MSDDQDVPGGGPADADAAADADGNDPVFIEDLLLTDTFLIKGRVPNKVQRLRRVLEGYPRAFLQVEDATMVALVGNDVIRTPRVLVAMREIVFAHELVPVAGDEVQRKLAAPDKNVQVRAFYNGAVQLELSGRIEPHAYEANQATGADWFVMLEPRVRGLDLKGNPELAILERLGYAIVRKDRLSYIYDFS